MGPSHGSVITLPGSQDQTAIQCGRQVFSGLQLMSRVFMQMPVNDMHVVHILREQVCSLQLVKMHLSMSLPFRKHFTPRAVWTMPALAPLLPHVTRRNILSLHTWATVDIRDHVHRLGRRVLRPLLRSEIGDVSNRRAWHNPSKVTNEVRELYKAPLRVQNWDHALVEVSC